jgi:diguanylate cyclase (GGDEF)-like protein
MSVQLPIISFSKKRPDMNERVLIIEDNSFVANTLQSAIERELGFKVTQARSMKEAEQLIEVTEYLVALCDINLPDAPNGEIIDFVLDAGVSVIVLTGSNDSDVRDKIVNKNIVDFILKSRPEDIPFAVKRIKEVARNRNSKILVVDDSKFQRKMMTSLLQIQRFQIVEAVDGADALEKMKSNPDVKMVLTDYNMPNINGLDLTIELRKEHPLEELAIIAISAVDEPEILTQFLKMGATDFIHKPYVKEEFDCRINNTITALENIEKVFNLANRDYLTGLYNRRFFFKVAQEYYDSAIINGKTFALLMIDVDYFKKVNDTIGHDAGDMVLQACADSIKESCHGSDIICRFGGEEFLVLLKDISQDNALTLADSIRNAVAQKVVSTPSENSVSITISIGITLMASENLSEMIKIADKMLYRAKDSGRNCVAANWEVTE